MTPKVSVIVAVYNPGANIDDLVRSLETQSLAPDDLEVVFVDDGSTDGTYERLRDLSGNRPGFTVTAIPNSGWPGRPRNVGTDLATGDYVFYADHDDELLPEALERMHTMAVDNHSDIVYGKVVGVGRQTPFWTLARRDIPVADLVRDSLVTSRTVHKLFRRAFLVDNNIRFPEGKVRLEDHNFMAQALPAASVVSVLASYPCYRWVNRKDGTNSSSAAVDFDAYWGYFEENLSIFEEKAGPGPQTDAALLAAGDRIFLPITPRRYFRRTEAEKDAVLRPLSSLLRRHLPSSLDHRIPVLKRLRIQALRRDDRSAFDQLQNFALNTRPTVHLREVSLRGGLVEMDAEAMLTTKGGPSSLQRHGNELVLSVGGKLDQVVPAGDRALLPSDLGRLELSLRHRTSGVEWPLDCRQKSSDVENRQGVVLGVTCQATTDGANNTFGSPLETGIWDVVTRAHFLGEMRLCPLPVDPAALGDPLEARSGTQLLRVYRTRPGNLALKITDTAGPVEPAAPAPSQRPRVVAAIWEGTLLAVTVQASRGAQLGRRAHLLVRTRNGSTSTEVRLKEGRARVAMPGSDPSAPTGQEAIFDFFLVEKAWNGSRSEQRLAFGLDQATQQVPYQIYPTIHGSFSVKRQGTTPA